MKKSELAFSIAFVPWDAVMLFSAGLIAYGIRFQYPSIASLDPATTIYPFTRYVSELGWAVLLTIGVFAWLGLYRTTSIRRFREEIPTLFTGCSTTVLVVVLVLFFQREVFLSRFLIVSAWILSVLFVVVGRFVWYAFQWSLFYFGIGRHRVVLIGSSATHQRLLEEIQMSPTLGFEVVGTFSTGSDQAIEAIRSLKQQRWIDDVIFTSVDHDQGKIDELIDVLDELHIPIRYCIDRIASHTSHLQYSTIGSTPVMSIERTTLEGWGKVIKRMFDIVGAIALIVFTSPLLLIVALVIKLDSRGPVFFRHDDDGKAIERVGQAGEQFRYLKFRTMKERTHRMRYGALASRNARGDGPMVKIPNDPRVTRIGKLLRKFSIDELPELFLVFRGWMSLVGPRPHFPEEVQRFTHHQRRVLTIKPGMTGLAQVNGRSDLTFDEEVRLDLYYIEHWSFLLDLWILLKTPFVVAKGTKDV